MSSIISSERLAALQKEKSRSEFTLALAELLVTNFGETNRAFLASAAATPLVDRYLSAGLALQNATAMHDSALEVMREAQKHGPLGSVEQATSFADAAIVFRDWMYPEKVADAALKYRGALVGVKASIVAKAAELLCGPSDLTNGGAPPVNG